MRTFSTAALSLGAALATISAAHAEEAKDWSLSGDLAVVSDYRYRGYSLTERDPAVQGELTLSAANGLYVYGWASSIHNAGDDVELMGALGWAGDLPGAFTLDAGLGAYAYPGLDDSTLYEFYGILSHPLGMATITGELSYFPEQDNLGGQDNIYAKASVEAPLPVAKLSAFGGIGWEDGAYGDDKIDWSAGLKLPLDPLELRLSYVGTNVDGVHDAGDTILAEIHYKFSL